MDLLYLVEEISALAHRPRMLLYVRPTDLHSEMKTMKYLKFTSNKIKCLEYNINTKPHLYRLAILEGTNVIIYFNTIHVIFTMRIVTKTNYVINYE